MFLYKLDAGAISRVSGITFSSDDGSAVGNKWMEVSLKYSRLGSEWENYPNTSTGQNWVRFHCGCTIPLLYFITRDCLKVTKLMH